MDRPVEGWHIESFNCTFAQPAQWHPCSYADGILGYCQCGTAPFPPNEALPTWACHLLVREGIITALQQLGSDCVCMPAPVSVCACTRVCQRECVCVGVQLCARVFEPACVSIVCACVCVHTL